MVAMAPERSRTLHNFSLPPRLTWGAQKLLRCAKLNNNSSDAVSDPNRKRRNSSFRSPPSSIRRVSSSSTVASAGDDDDQIEVMREKLMLDLRSEVDKMRAAILGNPQTFTPPPPPPPPPPATESRPWNLRTRRAACKDPMDDQRPIPSPIRVHSPAPEAGGEAPRAKFAVALSRQEIEDDFLEMMGRRPPRKPKKRPRYVQRQMDTLFPGLWLSEINADMYKVDENNPELPK